MLRAIPMATIASRGDIFGAIGHTEGDEAT
jgi:hypothetical protein